MKINILRGVLIILLICTFGLIFNFSSQDAPKSKSVSKQVTEGLVNTFHKKENEKSKIQRIKQLEPIIRKCAHFSIYMVVGILLICLFNTYNLDSRLKIVICIAIGFAYACSDEIHQMFVNRKKRRSKRCTY